MHAPSLDVQTQAVYPLKLCLVENASIPESVVSNPSSVSPIFNYMHNWSKHSDYSLNVVHTYSTINKGSFRNIRHTIHSRYNSPYNRLRDTIIAPQILPTNPVVYSRDFSLVVLDSVNAIVCEAELSYLNQWLHVGAYHSGVGLDSYGFISARPENMYTNILRYDIIKHLLGFGELYPFNRSIYYINTLLNGEIQNISYNQIRYKPISSSTPQFIIITLSEFNYKDKTIYLDSPTYTYPNPPPNIYYPSTYLSFIGFSSFARQSYTHLEGRDFYHYNNGDRISDDGYRLRFLPGIVSDGTSLAIGFHRISNISTGAVIYEGPPASPISTTGVGFIETLRF